MGDPGLIYFDLVLQAFERAARAIGPVREESIRIGGRLVRLHFAGDALPDRMMPAFGHLRGAGLSECDLRVLVWDSVSTGVPLPAKPWTAEALVSRGDVVGFNNHRIRTAFVRDPDLLSLFDAERRLAVYWTHDARELPYWESGSPLKAILSWWAQRRGSRLVHAAAVGRADGGVLIVGKGGSGKSTTAISCLVSSLGYCGDDYVLVQAEPAPHVYSLYNSGKLDSAHVDSLPHVLSGISNRNRLQTEKALIFIWDCFPEKIVAGFPIRAILVPRIIEGAATSVRTTTAAAALFAIAPSSIFQLPGADGDTFAFLSRLVKQVPCLRLDLGRDLARIPEVIDELLSRG
jgi:hypothetical protein